MKLFFVRHGHPNYREDRLTELGHKQAQAAAERLKEIPFDGIFASTHGRAMETAKHTAELLGMEVVECEFMRELTWRAGNGDPKRGKYTPWVITRQIYATEGKSIPDDGWTELSPFAGSDLVATYKRVVEGFDNWLASFGYTREGDYYRVTGTETDKTLAIFSHGGASSAAISHLIGYPFLHFCKTFEVDYTSITAIELSNEQGALFTPKVLFLNDASHIQGL